AALLLVHKNRVLTYIFIFILFGTMRPLTYIIDVWSIRTGTSDPSFSYGFTRSFGSLAYAVASLLYGLAIDAFGTGFIIPCFLVLCVVTMYVVVLASSTPKDFAIEKPRNKIGILRSLYVLFSNKYYILLVVCFTLMEISRMPGQNYLTRKFEVMGAKEIFTGLAFFVTAIIQLPALNKMDSLKKRHRATSLMWVSLTGVSLRITLLGITTTTLGTLCSLLIDLVGLGLYVGSLIYYMLHFLPPEVHFLGMTVYAAFTGGLGGMIGNYIAGILANKYGVLAMYKLTAIPAAVGLLIYSICMFAWRKGNPES
ncbi:MAG: MFS transporter, partial [Spirochaetales bacterium]|nr:MFS transporter [Spirochaetales bacterium]